MTPRFATSRASLALAIVGIVALLLALAVFAFGQRAERRAEVRPARWRSSPRSTSRSAPSADRPDLPARRAPSVPAASRASGDQRAPRGATGPQGVAGSNNERVYNLSISWRGAGDARPSNEYAQRNIPGLGVLKLACPATNGDAVPGGRLITLTNNNSHATRPAASPR